VRPEGLGKFKISAMQIVPQGNAAPSLHACACTRFLGCFALLNIMAAFCDVLLEQSSAFVVTLSLNLPGDFREADAIGWPVFLCGQSTFWSMSSN
jgi:hypothetical protein